MSDEQRRDPQQMPAHEPIVDSPTGPRMPTDPTPADGDAGEQRSGSTSADHSAWMRPADGLPRRTSEVVGALHHEPTADPSSPSGTGPERTGATRADLAATAAPEATASDPTRRNDDGAAADPHQMAALVGARAALAREDVAGASLAHAPEVVAAEGLPTRSLALRLLPLLAGALALALIVFGIVYASTRKPVVVVSTTPTPSASTPAVVADADLMSVAQARLVDAKATWQVASTLQHLEPTSPRVACLNSTTGQPNPATTRQRTLTTTSGDALAALHQIDDYATVAQARQAFAARTAQLAACSDVPAWLAGADAVTGLGDQTTAVTIAFQDQPASEYHTVLLTRTGTTLHAVDVTRNKQSVPTAQVLPAVAAVVNAQCARSGGACAPKPSATPTTPPAVGTPGWLLPADLPRVNPGQGLWTSTDTAAVSAKGSQCENMTLASAPGATTREQRTYLMTQDSAAPQTFGIDEMVFTFADEKAAASFAQTLQKNLTSCPSRSSTAKVSDARTVTMTMDGARLGASTLLVTQSVGGSQSVLFRTGVVTAGHTVAYLVSNPSTSYDLGLDSFVQVALRAGQRVNQAQ